MNIRWNEQFNFKRLFDDLDREFTTAQEMLNMMLKTVKDEDLQSLKDNFPYYYGYQIIIGSNGKPQVKEFGDIRPTTKGLGVEHRGTWNPLIDTNFNEQDNAYVITAEMPGVTKEGIKVSISKQNVIIKTEHKDKKYLSEIPFDVELDDTSAKATYTNGLLELKIKAKAKPKPRGREIKVE
jgi:HSP20 family protein